MTKFVKFTCDEIDGVGKVIEANDDISTVEFPSGSTAEFKNDELTEITEDEYKEASIAIVDKILAGFDPSLTYESISKMFDSFYEVSARVEELLAEIEKKDMEIATLNENYAKLFKDVVSAERFEEIQEIHSEAYTTLSDDENEAKEKLGSMTEDEYNTFKTMAIKFVKLTERSQTNLRKTTDYTMTNQRKLTDDLSKAELDKDDDNKDVDAAIKASELDDTSTFQQAICKFLSKSK